MSVRQFPSGQGFVRIGIGLEPRWKKDGSELYFLDLREQQYNGPALMAVPMKADGRGGISAGVPVKLFQFKSLVTLQQNNSWRYAPSPDGQRFLVAVQPRAPRR